MAEKTVFSLRSATVKIVDSDGTPNEVTVSENGGAGSYLEQTDLEITAGSDPEFVKDRGKSTAVLMPEEAQTQQLELTLVRVANDPIDADLLTLIGGGLPSGWVQPLKLKITDSAGGQTLTTTVNPVQVGRRRVHRHGTTSGITFVVSYATDATITSVQA